MAVTGEVLLGRLAVEIGLISQEELDLAIRAQVERGGQQPLGELLVDLGLLSRLQLDDLLSRQKANLQAPSSYSAAKTVGEDLLGRRAVEARLMTQKQLAECLRLQGLARSSGQPKRLGEIVVEQGILTVEQVRQLLSDQGKRMLRCPRCTTQYNVHGATKTAAPKCRHCGVPLVEASAPPSVAPTRDARKLKAAGTWYGKAEDVVPPAVAAPPKKPARARVPKSERVGEDLDYLPYDRRVEVSGKRKAWTVAGAVGLFGLIVLLLVKVAQPEEPHAPSPDDAASHAQKPPEKEAEATPPTPTAAGTGRSLEQEFAEIDAFLRENEADPVACLRRVEELGEKVAGTREEERVVALTRKLEERVRALGKGEFDRRMDASRRAETEQRFGEALQTLADLSGAEDPFGYWNAKIAEERRRVSIVAVEEWNQIAAKAERLARDGKKEEALREAARGETFGIREIAEEARALAARIAAVAGAPPPTPAQPPAAAPDPTAGAAPPSGGTVQGLLDSLAGAPAGDTVECPLCRDLSARSGRACPTCKGLKQAPCPMCKGTGKWSCVSGVHKAGPEEGDPSHVKKKLGSCKVCNNRPEAPCTACRGSKTVRCKGCDGKGTVGWTCPLSKASSTVPRARVGGACWLCQGKTPVVCAVCGGQGGTLDDVCLECFDAKKARCSKCGGPGREACEKCGGSGYVRTLTKGGEWFDPESGMSGSDAGGKPDAATCDLCGGKGARPCDGCSRAGIVPCGACTGDAGKRRECWACQGKAAWQACPECADGPVWWAQTPGGAVFLSPLADLEPLVDRGMHSVLGARFEWLVLIVDDRNGTAPVAWTNDLGSICVRSGPVLRPVPGDEIGRVTTLRQDLDDVGRLFGLRSGLLAGKQVDAGRCAVFLLAFRASPKLDKEVTLHAPDGQVFARLAQGRLDCAVRQALLSRYWTRACMER